MVNKIESHTFNSLENKEAKEFPERFDALVVLGKNWREYPPKEKMGEFKLRLSLEAKMSVLAAGEMFKESLIDKIIFSGGKTAGKEYPSESEQMAVYLREKYPNIPETAIILEEKSTDTVGNAEKIAEIIKENPELQKLALMTTESHTARA